MAAASSENLSWTRVVLIIAAATAALAIGMSTFKPDQRKPQPATIARQPSDVGEMIPQLEQRLARDPSSAEGWRLLGWSYAETGRQADAIRAYRRSAKLAPARADVWSALGEALVLSDEQGFPPEASDAFAKALSIDPKEPRARFFLGAEKLEKGDANSAIDDWIAILKDAPAKAPYAISVRQKIEEVAAAKGVSIADRLPTLPESVSRERRP